MFYSDEKDGLGLVTYEDVYDLVDYAADFYEAVRDNDVTAARVLWDSVDLWYHNHPELSTQENTVFYDFADKSDKMLGYVEETHGGLTTEQAGPYVTTAARAVAHGMMRAARTAGITGEQLEYLRRAANVYAPFSTAYADKYL